MEMNAENRIEYKVIRRRVKRARLEYTREGLTVIVPLFKPIDVPAFLRNFKSWILKRKSYFTKIDLEARQIDITKRTQVGLERLIAIYVAEAENQLGVKSVDVRYRLMKRQWGNCTSAKVLTFNKKLAYLPDFLVRYIVYHEVCHLRSLRHGKLFKKLMLRFFPNIKETEQQLRLFGYRLGLEE